MYMARFFQTTVFVSFCKSRRFFLAFCWAAGLLLGFGVFRYLGSDLVSQMPLAVCSQPSIFGLLTSCLLPLLLSAFAVYIRTPQFLFGICFLKAFAFAYVSGCVIAAFGGGGWLVRLLFLFTDLWGCVFLYLYCQRHISGLRSFSARCLGLYGCLAAAAVWADLSFISPLLRRFLS